MLLFVDTETTGLWRKDLPHSAPQQPRIVQLAAILTDKNLNELSHLNVYITPAGYEIPPQASAIHGITTEFAREYGVPLADALSVLRSMAARSQATAGHNAFFDYNVLLCAEHHAGFGSLELKGNIFCTMHATTDHCKIAGRYADSYKWPKLSEAVKILLGEDIKGAHDAWNDLRYTLRLARWLRDQAIGEQQAKAS